MGRRIVLRPEAEVDLLQARDWYEQEAFEATKTERRAWRASSAKHKPID